MLGWALICPYAGELLKHGVVPYEAPLYDTGEEAEHQHEKLKRLVDHIMESLLRKNGILINAEQGYQHEISITVNDIVLCGRSKADLVYTFETRKRLYTVYVDVATRIHIVKPWQVILRGISLYYEKRIPVWLVIVSPWRIMYKVLGEEDQIKVLKRLSGKYMEGFQPSPNLCSLCEFIHHCPYRVL